MAHAMHARLERSSSPFTTHQATGDYTFRLPSPQRIVVPPPPLNDRGLPDLDLGPPAGPGDVDVGFLPTIDYAHFISTNSLLEWKYERRREAQKILPYLYLGPLQAAKDVDFLRREGITMLLAVRHTKTPHARLLDSALRLADELGLAKEMIDVTDNQELIAAFPQATRTINHHLRAVHQAFAAGSSTTPEMGKILVFCETGIERSAGIVSAYIMEMFPHCNDIKTMQIVHAQRFCVSFDDAMKSLLQSYQDILQARRAVSLASAGTGHGEGHVLTTPVHAGCHKGSKRSLDDAYNSDIDMEEGGAESIDRARFEDRHYTPFRDTHIG